jgi:hypothetical protein
MRVDFAMLTMNRDQLTSQPADAEPDPAAIAQAFGLRGDTPRTEVLLFARYVRALALLCECAPYVDEPHYAELIEELLSDASSSYPLEWRCDGGRYEIAPRGEAGPLAER